MPGRRSPARRRTSSAVTWRSRSLSRRWMTRRWEVTRWPRSRRAATSASSGSRARFGAISLHMLGDPYLKRLVLWTGVSDQAVSLPFASTAEHDEAHRRLVLQRIQPALIGL